ncbi:unnamed protein product [Polarella glacialis]|uniref:Uncharacterized protein n=1 Tax=Polarella glacialis TaxID=89957 RepID=A0A813I913_POLGL|nr:unnamed protein product [Polarella glacialis]
MIPFCYVVFTLAVGLAEATSKQPSPSMIYLRMKKKKKKLMLSKNNKMKKNSKMQKKKNNNITNNMASSGNDGRMLDITLVSMSGNEISEGTWPGHCKAYELFQAAYRSKPGFLCKLLHGSEELDPQSDLQSLHKDLGHLTVVWMAGPAQKYKRANHPAVRRVCHHLGRCC